jgi:hypothetical protein
MDFLMQLRLDNPLPLSATYQMAYIFMCRGAYDLVGFRGPDCPIWEPGGGANRVLLQRAGDSSMPVSPDEWTPEYGDWEVRWELREDPDVDTSGDHEWEDIEPLIGFRIGGVPVWIQNAESPTCPVCGSAMRFIAQLPDRYGQDSEDWSERPCFNFGTGDAYVFLCVNACSAQDGALLWQCD